MDEDEFWTFLESLDPRSRDELLYGMEYGAANEVPGTFNFGGGTPQLDYGSFDLGEYGALPPEMDKKGNVLPWGLDQEAQAFNALQDYGALTVDPAIALYGGPGAYDPSAFQPTEDWGDPLDQPGQRLLQGYATSGPGYESYLAQKFMAGRSPGQAQAEMWEDIKNSQLEDAPQEAKDLGAALIASLPPPNRGDDPLSQSGLGSDQAPDYLTPQGRARSTDLAGINSFAQGMFGKMLSDPQGFEGPGGLLYKAPPKVTPSALTAKYTAAGIPTPDETYMDEEWLNAPLSEESALGREEREGRAQDRYGRSIRAVNEADRQASELAKAWQEQEAERAKYAAGPVSKGDEYTNQYDLPLDVWRDVRDRTDVSKDLPGAPQQEDYRRSALAGLAPNTAFPTGAQGETLDRQREIAGGLADTDYRRAFEDWQNEIRGEAERKEAQSRMAAPETYTVRGTGNKLLGTYNFAGTPEEAQGVGRLAGVLAQFGSDPREGAPFGGTPAANIRIGQMGPESVGAARRGMKGARDIRQQMLDAQIRTHEQTSPDEIARASAIGRAMALTRGGRTPTNDVLMQRALARNTLMGRP
jgi:hypothetical protein